MHTMWTNEGVEVQPHPLTSALDGGGQLYGPQKSYPCQETNNILWLSVTMPTMYVIVLKQVKIKFTLEQSTKV
jgi:hypothetical protein